MRRTITGAVAILAAVVLAGCAGNASDTGAPGSSPSAEKVDPGTLLPASMKKIQSESFTFTMTMTVDDQTITSEGAIDLGKKVGTVTLDMGEDFTFEMRIIGDDIYMQTSLQEGQWLHMDATKVKAGSTFDQAANPVSNADILLAVTDDVKEVGDGKYKGTLDLRKYLDEYAKPEEKKELEESLGDLGAEATKVPFEATVDDEGRLTEFTTTLASEVDGEKTTIEQTMKFSDFGAKVDVEKPPADKTQEAPAEMYDL